jgi:hypothetical protein
MGHINRDNRSMEAPYLKKPGSMTGIQHAKAAIMW